MSSTKFGEKVNSQFSFKLFDWRFEIQKTKILFTKNVSYADDKEIFTNSPKSSTNIESNYALISKILTKDETHQILYSNKVGINNKGSNKKKSSIFMIVGIVIGALVVASVIIVTIFVIRKKQNGNKEEFERKESSLSKNLKQVQ